MYVIEYIEALKVSEAVDEDELSWHRYQPSFDSAERAHNEALWLSIDDDGRYVYRVIERAVAA
jgi:hypothetical protein